MQERRIQFLTARKAETPFGIGSSRHCKIGSILLFCFSYAYINIREWAGLSGNMTVHDMSRALEVNAGDHVFTHRVAALAQLQEEPGALLESHAMFACTCTCHFCHITAAERCVHVLYLRIVGKFVVNCIFQLWDDCPKHTQLSKWASSQSKAYLPFLVYRLAFTCVLSTTQELWFGWMYRRRKCNSQNEVYSSLWATHGCML